MVELRVNKMIEEVRDEEGNRVTTVGLFGEQSEMKFTLTIKGDRDKVAAIAEGYGISYGSPVILNLKKAQMGLSEFSKKPSEVDGHEN